MAPPLGRDRFGIIACGIGSPWVASGSVPERTDLAINGGGQAGLAMSHELTGVGVEDVVLERDRVADSWRSRWNTFCRVRLNWSVSLPGGAYDGDIPTATCRDTRWPTSSAVARLKWVIDHHDLPRPQRDRRDRPPSVRVQQDRAERLSLEQVSALPWSSAASSPYSLVGRQALPIPCFGHRGHRGKEQI